MPSNLLQNKFAVSSSTATCGLIGINDVDTNVWDPAVNIVIRV